MADNPSGIPSDGFSQFLWLVGAGNVGVIVATIIGAVLQHRKNKAEAAAPAPAVVIPSERYSGGPTDWMAHELHQIEQNTDATLKLTKKLYGVLSRDRADRLRATRRRRSKK